MLLIKKEIVMLKLFLNVNKKLITFQQNLHCNTEI